MGMSSLFNMFGNRQQGNGVLGMIQQFNQFKNSFNGDARQQVQQMLDSGQISQQQFNQLSKAATQFQQMMRGR